MRWKRLTVSIGLLAVMMAGVTGCETLSPPTTSGGASSIAGDLLISQQSTGIWVTGEGSVTVVPDIVLLSLGVEAQADTVAVAQVNEMPNIEVRAISTDNPPTGMGEIGLASVGSAIANAVYAATGARVRHLPLLPERVLAALAS